MCLNKHILCSSSRNCNQNYSFYYLVHFNSGFIYLRMTCSRKHFSRCFISHPKMHKVSIATCLFRRCLFHFPVYVPL